MSAPAAVVLAAVIGVLGVVAGNLIQIVPQREQVQVLKQQLELQQKQMQASEDARIKAEREANLYRRIVEDAPGKFTRRLRELIGRASESRDAELVARSRALVAARNGYRSVLDSVGSRLDSEIDALEAELRKPRPDPAVIRTLTRVLQAKWPAKEDEIELAVRKLMTELGLVPQGGR